MTQNKASDSFTLRGHGGRIRFEFFGYENPKPLTVSDANWLRAQIHLHVGGCSLELEVALTTQEIKYFLDDLQDVVSVLEGKASFATLEEDIAVEVEITAVGSGQISGLIKESRSTKVAVSFEFESDPSFLENSLSELQAIQQKYPVIEKL